MPFSRKGRDRVKKRSLAQKIRWNAALPGMRKTMSVMLLAGLCAGVGNVSGMAATGTRTTPVHRSDLPDTGDDGLRCPSGPVHIVEVHAYAGQAEGAGAGLSTGVASAEICASDATRFTDVVTRGTPGDGSGQTAAGEKTGVEGTIQIRGRTAQMDANIYIPMGMDIAQCAQADTQQQDGSQPSTPCRPHPFVASFAGTWVFSSGKWSHFSVGTDAAGNPVTLVVRLTNGPQE
ncbi:hypothetical protein K2X14_05700 [Acetobacter sp. TBRC 12305]|uniref:Uncharacterized protein n=1 Tax=Acetobacter garciniae TaxID=2817435 RepID=A0A939HKY8_9PROT|nr:hypothetical protein [Acetobacter garciniae]MBO1324645.1 hypothetical protein [Acetobacter garciniae]MBX0344334.1 hypothetical protein [Acetobacter garciniae]